MKTLRTRLAPSPTGHLHLGHVLHIMYVQALSARLEADIYVRLEDHDQSRCRPAFASSIIEDLTWLGVEVPAIPWRQSARMEVYAKNLEDLMRKNLVYACSCSRKDVQAITQQQTGELTYPGTCRSRGLSFDKKNTALRLVMPDQPISFKDGLLGLITQNPATSGGDVMIRDRHGHWTYQFAVVVDDLDQDINLIIRGEDLLSSTGRQLVLRSYLRPDQPPPQFYHHPLIVDAQGQKLSKRLLSESIQSMRTRGSTADEVRGFVANLAGLTHSQKPITLGALPEVIKLPIKPT